MKLKVGIIILVHGTRGKKGTLEVRQTFKRLSHELNSLLPDSSEISGAALQFNHPNMEEAITNLLNKGAQTIVIVPYFLFAGRHITEDIPQIVNKFKSAHPGIKFIITETLGHNTSFANIITSRIKDAVPDLWGNGDKSAYSVSEIELQSMQVIENLLPANLSVSNDEREVVKRIIHASGDPAIVEYIRFSSNAVQIGINSLRKGNPVYTDVRMVYEGINKHLANKNRIAIHCMLDAINNYKEGLNHSHTRTSLAIKTLGKKLNDSIVVIGNAPTALLALIELIDRGEVTPSLVIGMPVGFIQAKESKDELMKRSVPYITITGTRGGSAMAVATVNALLKKL